MKEEPIKILTNAGQTESCKLYYDMELDPCVLEFDSKSLGRSRYLDRDIFECVVQLRLFLESKGYLLLCNASRIDCYPSGMSRSMSKGRVLNILRIGEHSGKMDTARIFDYAAPKQVATVEGQREFFERWLISVGAK